MYGDDFLNNGLTLIYFHAVQNKTVNATETVMYTFTLPITTNIITVSGCTDSAAFTFAYYKHMSTTTTMQAAFSNKNKSNTATFNNIFAIVIGY